jgi:hypothetical protein
MMLSLNSSDHIDELVSVSTEEADMFGFGV